MFAAAEKRGGSSVVVGHAELFGVLLLLLLLQNAGLLVPPEQLCGHCVVANLKSMQVAINEEKLKFWKYIYFLSRIDPIYSPCLFVEQRTRGLWSIHISCTTLSANFFFFQLTHTTYKMLFFYHNFFSEAMIPH